MYDPMVSSLPDPFVQQQAGQETDVSKLPDPFKSIKPAKETKSDVLRRLGREEKVQDVTPLLGIGKQELGDSMKATVSGAGAEGGMQVLPATGLQFVTKEEWATPEGKMRAGVRYYKSLLKQFNGNEQQAIAAYFTGGGNVNKAIKSGANLPNTLDPISNLRTPQYVNQVQQKIDKNIPDDVKALPDPFAISEDVKTLPDPFAKSNAPVVNVGAPGRGVTPNVPASIPAYQQLTPEQIDKQLNRPRYYESQLSPGVELQQREQIAQWNQWQQEHGQRLAELSKKEANAAGIHADVKFGAEPPPRLTDAEKRELASLRQTQIDAQAEIDKKRPQELETITKLSGARRQDALGAFVQRHGALTDEERTRLGLPTNYASKLLFEASTGAYSKTADLASGVLRIADYAIKNTAGETPDEFLQRAADFVQKTKETNQQAQLLLGAQNESGLRYAGGVAAHTAGELLPSIAGAMVAPEIGLPQTLLGEGIYWGGTAAVEGIGRKESAGQIAKGVAQNIVPVVGARFFSGMATGSALEQFGQRVLGNAALNTTISAAQGGDFHANLTAAIMGGFMGIHGHEDIPDTVVRKVLVDPEFQTSVAEAVSGPKFFIRAKPKIEAKLKEAGLTDEQATQFTDSLKSASAVTQENLPITQESTTTPESLPGDFNAIPSRADQPQLIADINAASKQDGVYRNANGRYVLRRTRFGGEDPATGKFHPDTPIYYEIDNFTGFHTDREAHPLDMAGAEYIGQISDPTTIAHLQDHVRTMRARFAAQGDMPGVVPGTVYRAADNTMPDESQTILAKNPYATESQQGENQNATTTGSEQRGQEYRGTARGTDLRENGGEVRQGQGTGPVGSNRAQESGQVQVPAENEPQVLGQAASVKAFITRADEAELRTRGYTDDQIYKMKPDEAQRILSRPATVTHSNPEIDGKPVIASTGDGRVVVENPANASGVSIVKDQTPLPDVNEFEAPKVATGSNRAKSDRSILEAVRALGRIQVDQDTIERGELSQFGNKESKGAGLIGPNGKLKPDYMREALEQEGFRDPGSSAEPGSPGSLSLDGMYELMDQEQRHGEKVYSAFRDANAIDADLAAEYEKYQESKQPGSPFEHDSSLENEWNDPESALRMAYEDVIGGNDPNGDAFRYVADAYKLSPETVDELLQRATRVREEIPPFYDVSGVGDGGGEATTGEGRVTGIKNAVTDAERAERGLSPIEKDIYDEFPKVFDDVKRGIDTGKIDIRGLTREWAEHPRGFLSENEEAALIYDRARLYNNKEETIDEVMRAIATGDKAAEVEARARLAPIEDAIVRNEIAAVRSGTIWGRSGAMRQRMMKQDYSLANIERRFRAKTGDSPTPEQSAKFKKLSEDLEDANRAIAKRDNIISDLEAKIWAKAAARKEAASARGIKRAGSLDKISKEWDNQKDQLVRLLKLQGIGEPPEGGGKGFGGPEAGAIDPNLVTLPADVSKLLIEMARNRIRAGFTDAVDIVDRIHESIKDQFDITKRQISDAISGYGKQSKLSNDPIEVQLREVKRIRRLMSALEDAQNNEAPKRSGLKRDKPSQLVRELTRQINEALRKQGIKLEGAGRSPEEQYQSALDGVKTRLRNQIEDLDKQIETGIKVDKTKTPIPLDEEAKALTAERDAKKAILAELEGPQERQTRSEEQVSNARKNALRKQIDALDRQHGGQIVPEKASRTENYDDETHALMAERDMLRRSLQDPTTKNKEAVRTRLVEAERKLRESDLSRKEADYPSSIYDDAETKGLKAQLKATNKRIADARALPDKIAKLEAQKAEVIRRLRERDFSKPERPGVQPKDIAPEIAKRKSELKDLNKELAAAKAEQNQVDAIQKRNAELRRRIREKDFEAAPKAAAKQASPRVEAARQERAKLQAEYDAIKPAKQMTPEQRQAATERALEKSIADNESRIAEKRLMPDGKPEPANSPRIEALRARNTEVKKALEDLRANDPAVQAQREAAKLKTYHKQLATREVELNKTLADIKAGTYEPPTKRSQRNDPESLAARARAGRIQDEIEKELLKAQLAKRDWKEKSLDFAVKWRRNMLLSNPLTLAKLATAAASRIAMSPVEEAAGAIIGQIPGVKQIAAKAPREGGLNVKAEAKAILAYTRTLADIAQTKQILKTGKSNLDLIYGTKADLPPEAIEFFGRSHKVMKAPAQAAEYARSFEKQTQWALDNGLDPTDPVTLATIGSKAYLDSQRAILMQDNMAVTGYRRVLSFLREPSKTRPELQRAPNVARALEFMLPIVKVPTNFVAETANYAAGGLKALNTLRRANWDVSKLTPEEADSIMRSLKKQFVGVGLFALGYANADKFGGYYQRGEKRKEGAPGPGELRGPVNLPFFGHNLPHWLLHSPAMEVMQMGATFKHVVDAHQDQSTLGAGVSGVLAGVSGLAKQVPFLDEPQRISDALQSNRKIGKFFGETARDVVIPPAVKMYAAHQDTGVVRKPDNPLQDIKMAIPSPLPFNRKTVPTEADRKEEQKQKRLDEKSTPAGIDKAIQRRLKKAQ